MKTYFLEKTSVYMHGVFWIGNDAEEGRKQANLAASKDKDDFHDWILYEFGVISNRPNYADDEWNMFFNDAEHKEIYRGIRSV